MRSSVTVTGPPEVIWRRKIGTTDPLDAHTVDRVFFEIGLLVLEGDAAGLAHKVTELSALRTSTSAASVDAPA